MVQSSENENAADALRARIRAAFPDEPFSGAITPADDHLDMVVDGELICDEEQDLHAHLHGRKWSEIPAEVIERNDIGHNLLTDEAFCVFLPAWLTFALASDHMREMMAYAFSPNEDPRSLEWTDRRLRQLNTSQIAVLQVFLAYCLEVEPNKFVKDHLHWAVSYLAKFTAS